MSFYLQTRRRDETRHDEACAGRQRGVFSDGELGPELTVGSFLVLQLSCSHICNSFCASGLLYKHAFVVVAFVCVQLQSASPANNTLARSGDEEVSVTMALELPY